MALTVAPSLARGRGREARREGLARPKLDPSPARVRRREQLAATRLMVIVGSPLGPEAALRAASRAVAGGARLVQLRLKGINAREVGRAARALALACARQGALLLVNDAPGIARASGADGVHVGRGDAAPSRARAALGPERLCGWTVHRPLHAREARALARHLDYVGVGTVFASPTKPELGSRGLAGLRASVGALGGALPVFAIGGVTAHNALACIRAGAHGVAVASAVTAAPDPRAAVRRLLRTLAAAPPSTRGWPRAQ